MRSRLRHGLPAAGTPGADDEPPSLRTHRGRRAIMSQRDNAQHTRRLVSVVVPALNEADNVPGLLKRFAQFSVDHPDYDFELVLVDDGSDDGTGDLVLAGSTASDR